MIAIQSYNIVEFDWVHVTMITPTRRQFLLAASGMVLAAPVVGGVTQAADTRLHVACNQFCWINLYRRQGLDFNADLDAGLAEVKRSGMDGLEAMLDGVAAAEVVVGLLKKHGLEMRSFYTGATLHDTTAAKISIERVVATAAKVKEQIDLRIVVVNPTPLPGQAKSDVQLAIQAKALSLLGGRLAELGTTLAYHFHAPEWQNEGREFYHVMSETDPNLVKLCMDTHWVYRGSGNNLARVYEVVELHAKRTVEMHLRQSQEGVWTECLTEGDIDYEKLAKQLKAKGVTPLLVLEQAVEKGTPHTMGPVESHRRSRIYLEKVFAEPA